MKGFTSLTDSILPDHNLNHDILKEKLLTGGLLGEWTSK